MHCMRRLQAKCYWYFFNVQYLLFFFWQKGPFVDSVTVSNLSPGMYKFRLTVTDDADQTASAELSILVLTPEQSLREYMKTHAVCLLHLFYSFFNPSAVLKILYVIFWSKMTNLLKMAYKSLILVYCQI